MSYEKTTWVSGETLLSAENFNKMEQGIENADKVLSTTKENADASKEEIRILKEQLQSLILEATTLITRVNTLSETIQTLL